MNSAPMIANGRPTETKLPRTLEEFRVAQCLLPRSEVEEHNDEAGTPSVTFPVSWVKQVP